MTFKYYLTHWCLYVHFKYIFAEYGIYIMDRDENAYLVKNLNFFENNKTIAFLPSDIIQKVAEIYSRHGVYAKNDKVTKMELIDNDWNLGNVEVRGFSISYIYVTYCDRTRRNSELFFDLLALDYDIGWLADNCLVLARVGNGMPRLPRLFAVYGKLWHNFLRLRFNSLIPRLAAIAADIFRKYFFARMGDQLAAQVFAIFELQEGNFP